MGNNDQRGIPDGQLHAHSAPYTSFSRVLVLKQWKKCLSRGPMNVAL